MASRQQSPGVQILERDLSTSSSVSLTNVGAIAAAFENGPIEEPVTIGSERELASVFGNPTEKNYEDWFTAAQFLQYGGNLRVVRSDSTKIANAADDIGSANNRGSGATATVTVTNGSIASVAVNAQGSGYRGATVTISGGTGTGAEVVATVESGAVTGYTVISGGKGYDQATVTATVAGLGPKIKTLADYEANIEDASNAFHYAARTAGENGNSLKVFIADAGADQVLYLTPVSTGLSQSTNDLTVVRAQGGTSATTFADDDVVSLIDRTATATTIDNAGGTALSAVATTLNVSSDTGLAANDFLLIESANGAEIVRIDSGYSGGTAVTIARAKEATTAVSHADGSAVTKVTVTEAATALNGAIGTTGATTISVDGLTNFTVNDLIRVIKTSNSNTTTINEGGTFSDADTTLTVTSGTNFVAGEFIKIDNEILEVTSKNINDLIVRRGALGTTAATHADGATVTELNLTSEVMKVSAITPIATGSAEPRFALQAAADGTFTNGGLTSPAGATSAQSLSTYNISGWNYKSVVALTLKEGTVKSKFAVGERLTTNAATPVVGDVISWDPTSRILEVKIDSTNTGLYSTATGSNIVKSVLSAPVGYPAPTVSEGQIEKIERKLYVALDKTSEKFSDDSIGSAKVRLADLGSNEFTINSFSDAYSELEYYPGQKWVNVAARPGTSDYVKNKGGSNDELHVLVFDHLGTITGTPKTLLEKFTFVSKASDAKSPQGANNYYAEVIKNESSYIFFGEHPGTLTGDSTTHVQYRTNGNTAVASGLWGTPALNKNFNILQNYSGYRLDTTAGANIKDQATGAWYGGSYQYMFSGGDSGFDANVANINAALDMFADVETERIDYLLCGKTGANLSDSLAKANKLIAVADLRKDCVAFISPQRDDVVGIISNPTSRTQTNNIVKFFDRLTGSSYAVFDSGYKYLYDKYNDKYRYIPCNGDVAGTCVETAITNDPWFSPAGFTRGQIRNVIKLAYNPKKAFRDELYSSRVNPVVTFAGEGTVLFGDKTALSTPSAFDRINVRRLFLTLERIIGEAGRGQLFEQNDAVSRSIFRNIVEPYLRDVQGRRGITDFLVVCDETNNPADAIDRGEFYAEIFVKPTRTINFITLSFVATRTGIEFSEIAN